MQERIEALEREVMELRVELRVLQQVLRNALDSIEGEPGDSYMPLWDGRDDEKGQLLTDYMRLWRHSQRKLRVLEGQLAHTKDKDSEEARYLAKQLESHRLGVQSFERIINRGAREQIEANFMAEHDWQLVRVVGRTEASEVRDEACLNPNCYATRVRMRSWRDGQVKTERVIGIEPVPMTSCPWYVVKIDTRLPTRLTSGEEDIPF